ncbi:FAD/NAD(P)-binding protein [Kocuria palustris]|uniref:FAD/NAD(P)-binding protein n=1 Tax=Kocuria palustris TaxID=71999 RepID=UPI00164347D1|nr:FAD/NAD(P)-binding protein [Kocuria palustris]
MPDAQPGSMDPASSRREPGLPALRIAVIGAGPKALSALDSLGRRLRASTPDDGRPARRVLIDVIDPSDRPGTGAAYDPRQPSHLRLNVTASIVDVHEPGAQDRVTPSFRQWAAQHGEPAAGEDYPPRAVIGAYLEQAWDDVVAAMPERVRLRTIRGRAAGLRRAALEPRAWEARIETPSAERGAAPRWRGPYDEVLLATGHAADHPAALRHSWRGGIPLVPGVYPTTERLGTDAVAPGARVAVRGAALTFIDAALALTEGRGGAFEDGPDGRLSYRPGGQEPAAILPTARSGVLLDAKPDPGSAPAQALQEGALAEVVAAGRAEVLAAESIPAVLEAVERTAQQILRCSEDPDGARAATADELLAAAMPARIVRSVRTTLHGGAEPGPKAGRAARALRRGIAAAEGSAPGGPAWALGRAWSLLYSSIVQRISFARIPQEQWIRFRTAAAAFERWAFGPPLLNARKLEALVEAGIVDLAWLDEGVQIDSEGCACAPDGTRRPAPDVVVDAVLAPPGIPAEDPLLRGLVERGVLSVPPGRRGCRITRSAAALDAAGRPVAGLSVLGRPTEDVVLGHDTLNRRLHSQPQLWAQRLIETPQRRPMTATPPIEATLRSGAHGRPALPARLEPWMQELASDPQACADLLAEHGSPVNVLDPRPLEANAGELLEAAGQRDVDLRVFVARKANKMLAVVDRAQELGHGIDVGSERELRQVLDRGVPPRDIVLTAAIKPEPVLRLAVESGVTVVVDNRDELSLLCDVLARRPEPAGPVGIALRLAPDPVRGIAPTRFGESARTWRRELGDAQELERSAGLRVIGLHFHLHGYDPTHRSEGLRQAVALADALRERGHAPAWIDMGGGVPMSYLEDPELWDAFWQAHEEAVLGRREPLTWRGDGLGLRREDGPEGPRLAGTRDLYPYHQQLTRGSWLGRVLDAALEPGTDGGQADDERTGTSVAEALRARGLQLRCEPGRAMLDGCGLTLARVVFRKHTSDGVPIVGLEMNRTQCRSTSADFLVDPVLVPGPQRGDARAADPDDPWDGPIEAFLVGAYCVEAELILKRRIAFPRGVAVGDVIALPNTGGYLMHILESASHQIPLAANVVRTADGFVRDDIDRL